MLNDMKQSLKKYLCNRWNVPYTQFGVANPLYDYLEGKTNITFIDIGAHNGHFSRSVSACCSVKKGILIEPITEKAQKLASIFFEPQYKILDCLVSDVNGDIEFEINNLSETSSILHIKSDIPEHAEIDTGMTAKVLKKSKTLDTLISELNLDKIDVLKVDVQGAEHLVLEGAKGSLPKIKAIWTEVSFKPLYDDSSTFFDIHSFLTGHGYKFVGLAPVFRGPNGELLQCDALFVHE